MTQAEGTHAQHPAVLYAAKSTQDRRKSIGTQLADCRAFTAENGWDVVGEFSDEGFSAYSGNRGPNLERAKQAAAEAAERRSTTCMLVAQHSDRFARGAGDQPGATDSGVEVWHAMRRRNVHLRFVQNDEASKDAVYMALAAKMSHEESKRKSAATRAGKRRRAEGGASTGPLPLGYRLERGAGATRRVPDPDEARVVRRMFELLDEGKSIGQITRWLNGQGVRTKRGNAFGRSRVRGILRNPWYGGRMNAYGDVVDGTHEPLIPWEEFERISAKLPRSGEVQGRGGKVSDVALLSRILYCAHCGHGIWHRGIGKKTGKRRAYQCGHARHATGACDAASFDAQRTEEAVLGHLSDLFLDFESWLDGVTAYRLEQRDGYERALAGIHRDRKELDRREVRVRRDYRQASSDSAARILVGEIEEVERERERLDAEARQVEAVLAADDRKSAEDAMLDFWTELSGAIQREVVNADSVREANTALKERFAAIFVSSRPGDAPRLDFVLKEREPGAPLVTSQLWATDPDEEDRRFAETGEVTANFVQHAALFSDEGCPGDSGRLTKVNRCMAEGRKAFLERFAERYGAP